jgi:uncharacterized peroxidase-related enzyme
VSATYKVGLPPQTLESANPAARSVLQRAHRSLGFIPNMYQGMANLPVLLETYLDGYARFREASGFTPAEQEVVFLVVSRHNDCGYCTAAHSMIADRKSKVPPASLAALRAGHPLPDARLQALANFTERMLLSHGRPTQSDVQAFHRAGYEDRHLLDIVLAIAVKTLSNYTNQLFEPAIDQVFAAYAP